MYLQKFFGEKDKNIQGKAIIMLPGRCQGVAGNKARNILFNECNFEN